MRHYPIRNRSVAILLSLLAFPVAFAAGVPIDFRGVPMGASEAEFLAVVPQAECYDMSRFQHGILGDRICSVHSSYRPSTEEVAALTYAGALAQSISANFYADRLGMVSVSIIPRQFDQVVDALKVKFGAPTSEESPPFKTRGGVVAQNKVIVWQSGDAKITAELYASSLDMSSVQYSTAEAAREFAKRRDEASKANAKGL